MTMTTMTTISHEIESRVKAASSILITAHIDPDGDSIGTQLAIRRYLVDMSKSVKIINQGPIPKKYEFLPDIENIDNVDLYTGGNDFDLAMVIECPKLERTGQVKNLIGSSTPIINIDHHPDNTSYGDIIHLNSEASAVGEMLTEYFLDVGYKIDDKTATLLYAGILTDTGRFRYNSTTKRTMEIAGYLIESGADSRHICDMIYYSMSPATLSLTARVFDGIRLHENGNICLITLDYATLNNEIYRDADIEGMAEYTLYGQGVRAGALLKEIRPGETKVSLRSRDSINVSEVAAQYGGGGHVNAAGYSVKMPPEKAGIDLLGILKETVNGTI